MTSALFKKLNLTDQPSILLLNAPAAIEPELQQLGEKVKIIRKATSKTKVGFALLFAIRCDERDAGSKTLIQVAQEDAVLWIAYPKKTSKQYKAEFNRDSAWTVMGEGGYEPVRQIAIDDDWSALRFRHTDHIKTLTRRTSMAISSEGKRRTAAKPNSEKPKPAAQ